MEIRSFTDLTAPDERTLRFSPLGLGTAGVMSWSSSVGDDQG
jgi:hypothetical protein